MSAPDVRGLWQRTLYRRADGALDAGTEVSWLQGPRYFVDIRQPVQPISFAGVSCLRELTDMHLAWLARQEAFAGVLHLNADRAWWQRQLDYQPQRPFEDRGRLNQCGDVLDEYGTELPYYEQWQRNGVPEITWGLKLKRRADSRLGFLVRADEQVMFARARRTPLASGTSLAEVLDAVPTFEAKQDLVDAEVSLGRVSAHGRGWRIERSTLPFKLGTESSIWLRTLGDETIIEMADLDSDGRAVMHTWHILDADCPNAAAEFKATP